MIYFEIKKNMSYETIEALEMQLKTTQAQLERERRLLDYPRLEKELNQTKQKLAELTAAHLKEIEDLNAKIELDLTFNYSLFTPSSNPQITRSTVMHAYISDIEYRMACALKSKLGEVDYNVINIDFATGRASVNSAYKCHKWDWWPDTGIPDAMLKYEMHLGVLQLDGFHPEELPSGQTVVYFLNERKTIKNYRYEMFVKYDGDVVYTSLYAYNETQKHLFEAKKANLCEKGWRLI